jgi:hypothetical protein
MKEIKKILKKIILTNNEEITPDIYLNLDSY